MKFNIVSTLISLAIVITRGLGCTVVISGFLVPLLPFQTTRVLPGTVKVCGALPRDWLPQLVFDP